MRTFITSDLHFFHTNVIKYENRPFANVEEMNEGLLKNINDTVPKRDHLLILGDFAFSGGKKIQEMRDKIKCENVDLLLGNHDRSHSTKWWREKGFNEVYKYPIILDSFWIMSHEPLYMNDNMPFVNIHGHTHGTNLTGNFFNVSVEQTEYKPILFEDIKARYIEKDDEEE
jgi:calcineurin-like phosphoesterase family protein